MSHLPRLRRRLGFLAAAGALCAVAAPAADAATTAATSSNWAGYAAMRSGVRFKRVSAAWTAPTVDCSDGRRTWSAVWVGLGGYKTTSTALEQLGTEADCSSGKATYSTWYELVPSLPHSAKLTVRPGDWMTASATISGHTVKLRMADDTTKKVFTKTLHASAIDTSSAEWIVEAPSACGGSSGQFCQVMPLSDFGTTQLDKAQAVTAGGHTGTISDTAWDSVALTLSPDTRGFRGPGPSGGAGDTGGGAPAATSGGATPGTLDPTGGIFSVNWAAGS
jgi:hypothetical protein